MTGTNNDIVAQKVFEGIEIREHSLPWEEFVFPCSVDEISDQLVHFSAKDLKGLCEITLINAHCKKQDADARYVREPVPMILLYLLPSSLQYKVRKRPRFKDPSLAFSRQYEYGMRATRQGIVWLCQWKYEDWRRFILEYVLAHEIGHHVFHEQRQSLGLRHPYGLPESEKVADDYARRTLRRRRRAKEQT